MPVNGEVLTCHVTRERTKKKKNIMKQTRTQRTKEKTRNLPCARCVGASRRASPWIERFPCGVASYRTRLGLPPHHQLSPLCASPRLCALHSNPFAAVLAEQRSFVEVRPCVACARRTAPAPHARTTTARFCRPPFRRSHRSAHTHVLGVSSPWEARKRLERLAVFNAELDCHTFAQLDTCPSSIESCNGECGQKGHKTNAVCSKRVLTLRCHEMFGQFLS